MPLVNLDRWGEFLARNPDAHLLQTTEWGELKSAFGWEAARLVTGEVGAQILFRDLPFGFSFAYIARGPIVGGEGSPFWRAKSASWDIFLDELDSLCKQKRSVFLKVEPDVYVGRGEIGGKVPPAGFQDSPHAIQPSRTIVVNLVGDEEEILARMKQKTRYNIRLAQKKGVVVRSSSDVELFHRLIRATAERDRFGVHNLEYYHLAYDLFHARGSCELLFAEYQRQPLAAIMVFVHGKRAWYLFGASVDSHRDRMPTYLLQWEAMRWAHSQGCIEYDLWGVPDHDLDTLEAQFARRSNGLWGVYRFKRGFGGQLRRAYGPWDRVFHPSLYRLYLWWATRRGAG